MKRVYRLNKKEGFFFIGYFLLGLAGIVIGNSYLFGNRRFELCEVVQYISALFFGAAFCTGKYKTKDFLVRLVIGIVVLIITVKAHNITFGLSALSLLASLNIDVEKIVKNSIKNNLFFLAIVVFPALLGLIRNDIYNVKDRTVYCFGFAYYSNVPNLVLMTTIFLYWTMKSRKSEKWLALLSIPVNFYVYELSGVRLTFYLYLIFLVVVFLTSLIKWEGIHKYLAFFATIIYPVAAAFSIIASLFYTKFSVLIKFNEIINNRLSFNRKGFMMYGIKLFGQKIEMSAEYWDENYFNHYFYIDCGYVHTLLSYGVLFFVMMIVMYSLLSRYAVKTNDYKLAVLCFLVCIYLIINNIMFSVEINPLPIIAFNIMWKEFLTSKKDIMKNRTKVKGNTALYHHF